jgi:fatty-acyl-CoA synthase
MGLSYSQGLGTTPLLGETIGANFDRAVATYPDRDALVARHQGLEWTYRELGEEVDRAARALAALGLRKGDRLGIWAPNCAEWVVVQFATAKLGVILVNVNPAYRTSELSYVLRQSGCKVLVSATKFKTSDYRAMIEEVRPDLPDLEHVLFIGEGLFEDAPDEVEWPELDLFEPINIQYTSGTTGQPKGATLSHSNILNNGYFVGEYCRYTEEDRVCIPVPFYHCFGMVMGNLGCVSHGACMVIPAPSFEPEATLAAIAEQRCTSLYGVPTMFIAELEHASFDDHDLSSLRTGIMAGSPCPEQVMRKVIDRMNMEGVTICYGMTETSPVSTQTTADDELDRRVGTVGRVHPHVEVKIVHPETGRLVPRGEPGELCTRGYSVMLGYWDDEAATAAAIDAARWMHTGDLAAMDDEGYVQIVGRIKDLIIRGGENIAPKEIEDRLREHPGVADAYVYGVADAFFGEAVAVAVRRPSAPPGGSGRTRRPDAASDAELAGELKAWCAVTLAKFKVPKYVRFVEEFPMTASGKIQKYKLREEHERLL